MLSWSKVEECIMSNGLMMQYFEESLPADSSLWNKTAKNVTKLKNMGVTAVWMPPAYKGAEGVEDSGYHVYDPYDLGEFKQKGTIPTKYGTKQEYLAMIATLQEKGIEVYADTILNRREGADVIECITADEFHSVAGNQMIGESRKVFAESKFTYPGRKKAYSSFEWDWKCFQGIDWNREPDEESECDYVLSSEVNVLNPTVAKELKDWGLWYLDTTKVNGFRLDAAQALDVVFCRDWLNTMREHAGRELFSVGEVWNWNVACLKQYLEQVQYQMSLFDVPLHLHFYDAAKAHGSYDMSKLLEGTLVSECPLHAVTFVDNHDSQPGQIRQSWVEDWFKPLAYAVILLREGGYPCLFYGDYYGIARDQYAGMKKQLDTLLKLRKNAAYGQQHDYFDDYNVVGWTREGDSSHKKSGLAVVMSDGTGGTKRMYIGKHFAGKHFIDAMGNAKYNIKIDEEGYGQFYVNRDCVAVWVPKDK